MHKVTLIIILGTVHVQVEVIGLLFSFLSLIQGPKLGGASIRLHGDVEASCVRNQDHHDQGNTYKLRIILMYTCGKLKLGVWVTGGRDGGFHPN